MEVFDGTNFYLFIFILFIIEKTHSEGFTNVLQDQLKSN